MTRVHVALVPGFFGFANLGDLAYFGHVHAFLRTAYAARGFEPVLHVVKTHPTATLPRRAVRVLDTLVADAADDAPIHLVGHSSGGLGWQGADHRREWCRQGSDRAAYSRTLA